MNRKLFIAPLLLAGFTSLAASHAFAQSLRPSGYFAEAAVLGGRDWALGAGLVWNLPWHRQILGEEVTSLAEGSISHWQARGTGHSHGFTHVALVPLARVRFDGGRSPWFADAGIGVSLTDRLFVTQTKTFTTRFNFVDTLGIGRSFGADRRQDLSLRLQHVSNAGIRVPNPGQNFLQLRYAGAF
jgi:lipid A 3-O-deacylase